MLYFSKSLPIKKQTHLHLGGLNVSKFSAQYIFLYNYSFKEMMPEVYDQYTFSFTEFCLS